MKIENILIYAQSRRVLKEWIINHIGQEKFKELNSKSDPLLLTIECQGLKCGRVYNWNCFKNIPKKSKQCSCGNWIIKYIE